MSNEIEFINHLSKEIETHTNAMMTYRTRIAFIVFLGPFVLLSSVLIGTNRVPDVAKLPPWTIIAVGFCYIVLGLVCGMIERGMWNQCNRWRALIVSLTERKDVDARSDNVRFDEHNLLVWTYILAFALFFISFVVMIFLISYLFG